MVLDPLTEIAELFGAPLDRRRFLKGSAAGIALLGVGSMLPAGCRSYPKPATPLRFFSAKEYAIVNQVAKRLLGVAEIGSATPETDVAARLDGWLVTWDADSQQQLRVMLRVFEHGTYLFDLQRTRFTMLSDGDKDRYVDGWMRSTLAARRVVFRALKALASLGFYQDSRSWDALGYDGPWLGRIEATALLTHETAAPLSTVLSRPS